MHNPKITIQSSEANMAITFKCKKCSKAYKVGDDKAGKKFKCRQCSAPIKIPDLEVDDFTGDLDDDSDAEFAEYAPATRRRPKSKPKTKAKKSSNSSPNQMLLIMGAIGAMLVIGIAGYFLLGSGNSGNSPTDTAGNSGNSNSNQEKIAPVDQIKKLARAFHDFHDSFTRFPPADAHLVDGKPVLSWRVHILPFVGQAELYKQFNLTEPWDSPTNSALLEKIPAIFLTEGTSQPGSTSIMTFTGNGAPFTGGKGPRLRDFTDGSFNVILFVKAGPDKAVPWTKPVDLNFNPANPISVLGQTSQGAFLCAMADGGVRKIPVGISPQILGYAIQNKDGNVFPAF